MTIFFGSVWRKNINNTIDVQYFCNLTLREMICLDFIKINDQIYGEKLEKTIIVFLIGQRYDVL